MSYAFNVRKNADGELVLENAQYAAAHVPDGAVFSINGHEPREGFSPVATLGITLAIDPKTADPESQEFAVHVAAATSSYNAARPAPGQ